MSEYCSKNLSKVLYNKKLRDWSTKAFYLAVENDEGLYDLNQHKNLIKQDGWFPAYRLSTVLDCLRDSWQVNIYSYANWEKGTWSTVIQRAFDPSFQTSTEQVLGSDGDPRTWKEAIERGIFSVVENMKSFKKPCTESDY